MEASSWKNKKVGWFANSALPCGFCFGFAAGLGFAGFGDLRSRWPVVAAAMRKHEKRRTEDQWTGCCRHGLRMSPRNNSWPAFRLTQSLFLNVSFCIFVFIYNVLCTVSCIFVFLFFGKCHQKLSGQPSAFLSSWIVQTNESWFFLMLYWWFMFYFYPFSCYARCACFTVF